MKHLAVPTEDIVQLSQTLHALIAHLDERRYEDLASLFTPDGRWLRQGRWFVGRQEILQALALRPQTMRVRHLLANVLVTDWTEARAEVDAYMTAYRQIDGGHPELFSINKVSSTFCCVDGQWLIAEQQMIREFEFAAA